MAFNPYDPVHDASSYGVAVPSQPGFRRQYTGSGFSAVRFVTLNVQGLVSY